MGGAGSVLQHERNTYSRAEETRLLKLYNRQKREDKLSGTLHAAGIENLEVRQLRNSNLAAKKSESAHGPPFILRVDDSVDRRREVCPLPAIKYACFLVPGRFFNLLVITAARCQGMGQGPFYEVIEEPFDQYESINLLVVFFSPPNLKI